MKFRFNVKALLLVTAVIGLFLAVQIHVHSKANKFVMEMWDDQASRYKPTLELKARLLSDAEIPTDYQGLEEQYFFLVSASLARASLTDLVLCKRRVNFRFETGYIPAIGKKAQFEVRRPVYQVFAFDDRFQLVEFIDSESSQ